VEVQGKYNATSWVSAYWAYPWSLTPKKVYRGLTLEGEGEP
jgi:hypothetical protein